MTKKCVTLPVESLDELEELLETAKSKGADAVELRLDWLKDLDASILPTLDSLRTELDLPMILAIRPERFRGKFDGSDQQRVDFLCEALKFGFEYIELERDCDPALIQAVVTAVETAVANVKAAAAAAEAAAAEAAAAEAAAAEAAAAEAAEAEAKAAAEAEADPEADAAAEDAAAPDPAPEPAPAPAHAPAFGPEADADAEKEREPKVTGPRLILAHYDLIATPPAYEIINDMKKCYDLGAYMAKLCYYTRDYEDTASIIEACIKAKTKRHRFSVYGTGDYGVETLTQSPILGCIFAYCALDEDLNTYPGQIDIEALIESWED